MNRLYNEDKYAVNVIKLPMVYSNYGMTKKVMHDTFVASIFDGHGGDECSNYLKENLHTQIENWQGPDEAEFMKTLEKYYKDIGGYWKRLYRKRQEIYNSLKPGDNDKDDLKLRLTHTYLQLDYEFMTQVGKSGSTATSVFLYNMDLQDEDNMYFAPQTVSRLYVSQIGDTKCIICDKNGEAHALNAIHHPSSSIESRRLNKFTAGFATDSFGENRFMNFANTRAFGDLVAKSKGISAEPDITSYVIGDSNLIARNGLQAQTPGCVGGDECFLVLMTDGITNYATDQEVCDLIKATHRTRLSSPQKCAEEVVKYVEAVGGDDNATCIVIRLNNWGNWPNQDRTGKMREERLREGFSRIDRTDRDRG
jgi:protein phosphatase PTC6